MILHVKLRFGDFRTVTRSRRLAEPSDTTADFWCAARELLDAALPASTITRGIRLVGMGISGLAEARPAQQLLFADPATASHEQQRQLDQVTDTIHTRFGATAITRAISLAASERTAE